MHTAAAEIPDSLFTPAVTEHRLQMIRAMFRLTKLILQPLKDQKKIDDDIFALLLPTKNEVTK